MDYSGREKLTLPQSVRQTRPARPKAARLRVEIGAMLVPETKFDSYLLRHGICLLRSNCCGGSSDRLPTAWERRKHGGKPTSGSVMSEPRLPPRRSSTGARRMLISAPAKNLAKAGFVAAEMSGSGAPILTSLLLEAGAGTVSVSGTNNMGRDDRQSRYGVRG
jgi:hypothetical protein